MLTVGIKMDPFIVLNAYLFALIKAPYKTRAHHREIIDMIDLEILQNDLFMYIVGYIFK